MVKLPTTSFAFGWIIVVNTQLGGPASVLIFLKMKCPVGGLFGLLKHVNLPKITAWLKYYL